MVVAAVYFGYAKQVQGPMVAKHLAAGGKRESWWKAAGIGAMTMLAVFAVVIAGLLIEEALPPSAR